MLDCVSWNLVGKRHVFIGQILGYKEMALLPIESLSKVLQLLPLPGRELEFNAGHLALLQLPVVRVIF